MPEKVIILGGGVAGLSAAHELAHRGYHVEVYEKKSIFGGKARSLDVPGSATPGKKPLPGEHGFRFFPGFYWHLNELMQRIPTDTGTVLDNLKPATEIGFAQEGSPYYIMPASTPITVEEWIDAFKAALSSPDLGLSVAEVNLFVHKLLCFLGSGQNRRDVEYEAKDWWSFIDAANQSPQYQKILARGLTLMLVAMRSDVASTRTIGTILVQMFRNILSTSTFPDRVLNQPTNDAWFVPWIEHLSGLSGLKVPNGGLFANAEVTAIHHDASGITGVTVEEGGATRTVTGDRYLLALPVETIKTLLPTALKNAAGIAAVDNLQTSWMTGAMYYLDTDVPISNGHALYTDSAWAITAISQPRFWQGVVDLGDYGDGTVRGLLSFVVSDWDTPGDKTLSPPKTAKQCNENEILDEVWAQVVAHHATIPGSDLSGVGVIRRFLDPAITWSAGVPDNSEPLLINTVNSRKHRPTATTNLPNLYLASDYVNTHTDLACMEGANEAARMAVNAILDDTGSTEARCPIEPLSEPDAFKPFRAADAIIYNLNPNSVPALCLSLPPGGPPLTPSPPSSAGCLLAVAIALGVSTLVLGVVLIYLLFFV